MGTVQPVLAWIKMDVKPLMMMMMMLCMSALLCFLVNCYEQMLSIFSFAR